MVCLWFEPGAAGWQAQMKPLSYGGHNVCNVLSILGLFTNEWNFITNRFCLFSILMRLIRVENKSIKLFLRNWSNMENLKKEMKARIGIIG